MQRGGSPAAHRGLCERPPACHEDLANSRRPRIAGLFGGFPFALSVSFRAPRVTTPQGLTWQGPPILGEAKLWDPFTIDLRFPGLHRLSLTEDGEPERMTLPLERVDDFRWRI